MTLPPDTGSHPITYTFTLTADGLGNAASVNKTVQVIVAGAAQYALSLSGSNGRVSVNGTTHSLPYQASFASGTNVTLQAIPDSGYQFSSWSGGLSGSTNPTTITMTTTKTITANFTATQPTKYTLSLSGSNGQVSVNGTTHSLPYQASYASGTNVTLQAIPNNGFQFTSWGGDLSGTANPTTITMTANTTITANFTATPVNSSDPFNITLDFVSSITSSQKATVQAAASRWEQIITQGLPSVSVSIPAGVCGYGFPATAISGVIANLRIDIAIVPIDGAGGTVGEGGPCWERSSDSLPVYGFLELDSADVANLQSEGLLEDVILHEMGHVLGFGTLWMYNRSLLTGVGTSDPRFVGANAVREWQALGGTGNVPVENCLDSNGKPYTTWTCGSGSIYAHWDESTFGAELMTSLLNVGVPNPLSVVTIGSLQDLGYSVNYSAADPYSLPTTLQTQSLSNVAPLNFRLIKPVGATP